MTEQRLSNEAFETAITLIEGHGIIGAVDYVDRAMSCGSDRNGFWLRVRAEIMKRGN